MSHDPPTLKFLRKKSTIIGCLGGVFLLLLGLFLYQLLGPNPPIIVSPETTYITGPLGPDGLPDYEQYALELYRDGVTPENNAAVLLYQAIWPGDLEPEHYEAVAAELGLEQIPSAEDAFVPVKDESVKADVSDWLKQHGHTQETTEAAEALIDQAESRPWTSAQIPPLAEWVEANQAPLDLLVEASGRSHFFAPSPSLVDGKDEILIEATRPSLWREGVQGAAQAISVRAMQHLGEGRLDAAWRDVLATHRLARLVAQGHSIFEQLFAFAMVSCARQGTVALLDHEDLTPKQAKQIADALVEFQNFAGVADSIDTMERLDYLDAVLYYRSHDFSEVRPFGAVDWNVALRRGNDNYDRLAAAARMPTFAQRQQAFAQWGAPNILERSTKHNRFVVVLSRARRSDAVATYMLALLLPPAEPASNAQDRVNTQLELTRLAAALAVYRAEQGEYPDALDELTPGVLDAMPVDLYHAKPYLYERSGDGYLLYSTGANGVDDGGSNDVFLVYEGRSADDFDPAEIEQYDEQIPSDADDLSIRLPRPAIEAPQPPATEP